MEKSPYMSPDLHKAVSEDVSIRGLMSPEYLERARIPSLLGTLRST